MVSAKEGAAGQVAVCDLRKGSDDLADHVSGLRKASDDLTDHITGQKMEAGRHTSMGCKGNCSKFNREAWACTVLHLAIKAFFHLLNISKYTKYVYVEGVHRGIFRGVSESHQ